MGVVTKGGDAIRNLHDAGSSVATSTGGALSEVCPAMTSRLGQKPPLGCVSLFTACPHHTVGEHMASSYKRRYRAAVFASIDL